MTPSNDDAGMDFGLYPDEDPAEELTATVNAEIVASILATVSQENVSQPVQEKISDASDGAVTATVTNPNGLTQAGRDAAKALVQLPTLSWPELAKLARELAMDIKEQAVVLKEFNLTNAQFDYLQTYNDFFREAFAAACKEWHAPLSTQDRIKVEAAAILEDSLPGIGARMQNKGEGLPGVIEAAKLFAKVAGVGEREAGGAAPGERFSINIDLGGDKKITINATPAPQEAAQSPLLSAIPGDT